MESWSTQDDAPYPDGYPGIFTAGRVVNLRLFIPGKPVPQARPRGRVQQGAKGPYVQMYEEKPSKVFKEHVAEIARFQTLKTPPVEVGGGGDFMLPFEDMRALIYLRFNIEKPASYPKRVEWPIRKPDWDNLGKSVQDALVDAGILKDDNMVTDATVQKRYANAMHPEGVEVDLTVMPCEHV